MEYDVFIRDRLTEWDAVITALMFRDYDTFENRIGISAAEPSSGLVKFSGTEFVTQTDVVLDGILKTSYALGQSQIQVLSDVGEMELRYQIVPDLFEIQADFNVVPALLHCYLHSDNGVAIDAEITGELQAVRPISCEDVVIGVTSDNIDAPYLTEYFSAATDFELDAETGLNLKKEIACEHKVSLIVSAGITVGRYRKLAEFDPCTLREIDNSALDELDFEIAIQKKDRG